MILWLILYFSGLYLIIIGYSYIKSHKIRRINVYTINLLIIIPSSNFLAGYIQDFLEAKGYLWKGLIMLLLVLINLFLAGLAVHRIKRLG
jgi:hypothetical protein